jgi:hypothetical protein
MRKRSKSRGMNMGFWRKLRKLATQPEIFEYRVVTPLRWRLREHLRPIGAALGRKRLGPVVSVIADFNSKRPHESFAPDWYDLWLLYNDVRTLRPKSILEYGSGVSTVVLAHALRENGSGKLTSLESDAEWTEINRRALPPGVPCELIFSPAIPSEVDGVATWTFFAPPVEPDYIYLEGPPGVGSREITSDPLYLNASTIVIDGRTVNKNFLVRRMKCKWRYRSLFSNDTVIQR